MFGAKWSELCIRSVYRVSLDYDISITTRSDKLGDVSQISRFEQVNVDFYAILAGHINAGRASSLIKSAVRIHEERRVTLIISTIFPRSSDSSILIFSFRSRFSSTVTCSQLVTILTEEAEIQRTGRVDSSSVGSSGIRTLA